MWDVNHGCMMLHVLLCIPDSGTQSMHKKACTLHRMIMTDISFKLTYTQVATLQRATYDINAVAAGSISTINLGEAHCKC